MTSPQTASYSELTDLPEPHSQTRPLSIWSSSEKSMQAPVVTVCVPVFNKAKILAAVLDDLLASLSLPFELILIDDASVDGSLDVAKDFLKSSKVQDWTLVSSPVPIYETACDNIGMALARGRYFLEIQSDIYVSDQGFDARLIRALEHGQLGSISGRACHGFSMLLSAKQHVRSCFIGGFRPLHLIADFVGKGLLGEEIERGVRGSIDPSVYWVAHTNNRGPWMVRLDWARELGLLDSVNFFLGNDDHDFNFRSRKKGKAAGYAPVQIRAELEDGSTRQPRTGLNLEIFQEMSREKSGQARLLKDVVKLPSSAPKKRRIPDSFQAEH